MKIKVLHVIQGKYFGGAEQVVYNLVKNADLEVITPHVVCFADADLLKKLRKIKVKTFLVYMESQWNILIPLLKLIKIIKKNKIDIVHTHTIRSNLVGRVACFITRRKCVTHLHSPILRDFADLKRGKRNEFIDHLTRWIADRYIAVSESLRQEMIRDMKMDPKKIVAVHNAVDINALRLASGDKKKDVREEFNIPKDKFLIIVVALLRPRKGVDLLIKALKPVTEQFSDTYLLIVGSDDMSEDPNYGPNLRSLVSELNLDKHVTFAGFRNDVPAILKKCDLMVLPSRFGEGTPMTIIEAMALGLPVLSTKVEGIPELIEDKKTGFLIDPESVEQLVDKMIEIRKTPDVLSQIKENALRRAGEEFDVEVQVRRVEEIYKEVLAS
ncbi:hypothetical protein COY23_02635 [bacterium (Candidatus Torokbacteria) CG_4_10_14_0_2_um_filter_35_8]|nr:MAG: hypothetical protein COY23_02635 [bacterium (Candidatus Torokbacteria) CG_4_10_14_0_2_um_filter_35_8]